MTVDQRNTGGSWNLLGTFDLDPVEEHKVVLSDAAAGTWVIADAVRYVRDGSSTGTAEIIIDNTSELR